MRINFVLTLSVLSVFNNICSVKSVTTELIELENDDENCSDQDLNCTDIEGRKKRPGGAIQSQNVVVESGHGGGHEHESVEYYHEDEGIDNVNYVRRKKKGRKKGRKKNKGPKIHYKKLQPYIYAMAGMKLLLYHLLLKKFAFLSVASFFLSKISFVLASLVALKQFFNQPSHHRSSDSNKLEVVHIPIRKEKKTHKYYPESDWEESRFVPITFAPDQIYDTTPYYNYNRNQQDFNESPEDEDDINNRNTNEVYPENHQRPYQSYQSYNDNSNKKFYPNHANAGFL